MREVATGVWHWKAAHPEWKPGQTWDRMVSSYAVDTGEGDVLLFDPLDVPAELREHASAVVLTCPWHRRDAPQLGLPIHVPPPDPPDPDPVRGEVFRGGDTLPFGVRAFEGFEPNDLVLYVESRRAVPSAAGSPSQRSNQDDARRLGAMGECEARTQGARVAEATGATEDAASRRPARPDGTDFILVRPLRPVTFGDVVRYRR